MKIPSWLSWPSSEMIRGAGVGFILAFLCVFVFRSNEAWQAVMLIMSALLLSLLIVLVLTAVIRTQKQKLRETFRSENETTKSLEEILAKAAEFKRKGNNDEAVKELLALVSGLAVKARELAPVVVSMISKFFAVSLLVTLLGASVSIAIFFATFMQVERIDTQNSLLEAQRRSGLIFELSSILDQISLKEGTGEKLQTPPPLSQARIVALSRSLKPYKALDEHGELLDSFSSPERGQMLLTLFAANLDLRGLLPLADFSYADLKGAVMVPGSTFTFPDLLSPLPRELPAPYYLGGVNLRYANLEGGRFHNLDFNNSDLRQVNGKNSYLGYSIFSFADLRQADLTDADLQKSDLEHADLRGANLKGLKNWKEIRSIKKANLYGVKNAPDGFVKWALEEMDAVQVDDDDWR